MSADRLTSSRPTRVLVVDDHPIMRRGIVGLVNSNPDLDVVGEAEDGQDAVNQARDLNPDIILMDLGMPGMDGVEAIRIIKESTPKIGIIILTVFDTNEDIFRGLEAGARGYLLKDSPPEELIRAIHAVGRGESLLEPRVTTTLLDHMGETEGGPTRTESVLSAREIEVLELIAQGATNKGIAAELIIAEPTVKTHIAHIFDKLGVADRTQAVVVAAQRGIIQV